MKNIYLNLYHLKLIESKKLFEIYRTKLLLFCKYIQGITNFFISEVTIAPHVTYYHFICDIQGSELFLIYFIIKQTCRAYL